jgi:orotidine-5'-phosphate decarboxylase
MPSLPTPFLDIKDRLIVALDVPSVTKAWELVRQLEGTVNVFKIGYWLLLQPDANGLIDGLIRSGRKVFLDAKIYDIGETVRRGVQTAAQRGITFLTVHGDTAIMQAAVEGRGNSELNLLAVSVLTSLNDAAVQEIGYDSNVSDLVTKRVGQAITCGCDGVIASPADDLPSLRRMAHGRPFLIVTPGIRMMNDMLNDHARTGTPAQAIASGADYIVVGRPIIHSSCPAEKAEVILASIQTGLDLRQMQQVQESERIEGSASPK